jgi:hypothetical protein
MAKDGKHVIHAGGIFPNPTLNREGPASMPILPGTIGVFASGFTPAVSGNEAAIFYVANYDYLRCKTVDDEYQPSDMVVAIHPISGMFLNVRAAAGTYKKGDEVGVSNGKIVAGATLLGVSAFMEETITAEEDDLVRIVIK